MKNIYLIGLAAAALSACTKSVPVETMNLRTLVAPVQAPAGEPYLFSSADGDVFLTWVEKRDNGHELRVSQLTDSIWSEPLVISSGQNWFVNWADYPMIATNASSMIAHYLAKSG